MAHTNRSVVHGSFLAQFHAWGRDRVHEVSHVTSPFVHAVEQPVANAYHETQTQLRGLGDWTHRLFGAAALLGGAWLTWTVFGEIFPEEQRSLRYAVRSVGKRLRLL